MKALADPVPSIAREQEGSRGGGPGAMRRPPIRAPECWEFEVLRLLAEQTAIPFDQLARFIGCEPGQAAQVARHLTKVGYTDYGRTLTYEPHWVWLTGRGARFSGMAFAATPPKIGAMARMRAVNEVRLHIRGRAPEARWVSARSIVREQGMRGHRPNGVVEIGAERHAITVHLRSPEQERLRDIIETHMARYDALIAFAEPAPRALLERLKRGRHWPKLVIRPLPEAPESGRSGLEGDESAARLVSQK